MFNFFRSQGKATKYLLGFLLTLVALSMLLYLVPSYNNATNSSDPVLLQVGDQKLTATEASAAFQTEAKGRVPAEMMRLYFPQFINERMMAMAALEQARRLGITATDEEIVETLAGAPVFAGFFENGKLVRRQEFEATLAQQNLTPKQVFDQIREQTVLVKLRDVILESAVITPKEVEDEYKRKYERATVEYIAMTEADMRGKINISEDDVKKTWEAEKASYTQPEKYSFRVAVLSKDKLAQSMTVTDQELRAAYNASLDNFRSPEQIHARHILISTADKSDADKKALRTKAEELANKAKNGGNFIELAKANSEDAGNAPNGGDLGTFGRGAMVKEFEDVAFALKPGEVSGVVTTQFGYHIIKLEDKIPAKITPFENVRGDLEKELRQSKLGDTVQAAQTQMRAELVKNPADAANIAKKFNGELITVTEAARGAAIPTLGVTPEIDNALPGLQPNGVTELLSLPGDRAAVAILDKKIAGRPSTYDEAKAAVREKMMNAKAKELLQKQSEELSARIKKGEDLNAVAKSLGLKVETASDFSVVDTIPGIGPASYFQKAFTSGPGTIIGPTIMQNRTVVAKTVSKKDADMATFAVERKDLLMGLKAARAQQVNTLWMDSIVEKLKKDGDLKVNQEEVQRVAALYR